MPFTIRPFPRFPGCCHGISNAPLFLNPSLASSSVFCLLILMFLGSERVYAEWVLVDRIEEKGFTLYIDPATISHQSGLAEITSLEDFAAAQTAKNNTYLSRKIRRAYYCAEPLSRLLEIKEFSGNMGTGKVVYTFSSLFSKHTEWIPVLPDSTVETLWHAACDRK